MQGKHRRRTKDIKELGQKAAISISQPSGSFSGLGSLGIFFPHMDTEKGFETCDNFVKQRKFLQVHTQTKMTFAHYQES